MFLINVRQGTAVEDICEDDQDEREDVEQQEDVDEMQIKDMQDIRRRAYFT